MLTLSACSQLLGVDFDGHLVEHGDDEPDVDASPQRASDAPNGDATASLLLGAAITAGAAHACAITLDGGIACWGANKRGQLGDGTRVDARAAVPVASLTTGVSVVAAGGDFTCAVRNAAAYCWGRGNAGQLGSGDAVDRGVPTAVTGLSVKVLHIAAGLSHACALIDSGSAPLVCWGRNDAGQLGDGAIATASPVPVVMETVGGGVTSVVAGDDHTCAMTKFGTVWCWGSNVHGKLGNGPGPGRSRGARVDGVRDVIQLAAGAQHTCALTRARRVFCWGSNEYGQLGDGTTTDQTTPVEVSTLILDVTAIAAGYAHTCVAYARTGVTQCWGENANGALGDGTMSPTHTAGMREALTSFPAIELSAGIGFTCARSAEGRLACWGWNVFGQLGAATTTDSLVPIDVVRAPGT